MSRQAEAKIADEDDGEEVEDAASEIAVYSSCNKNYKKIII